jgi:hypothetical protein
VTAVIPAGCALLGWRYDAQGDEALPVVVYPRGERYQVDLWGRSTRDGRARVRSTFTVDEPTLLLAMTLAARAVPALDVGPCPECEGSKRLSVELPLGRSPEPAWEDVGPGVQRAQTDDWMPVPGSGSRSRGTQRWDSNRDCPACTIDGEPTGRRVVPAFEAVLLGEPRECSECEGDGYETFWEGMTVDRVCRTCDTSGTIPGHEGALAALRQLAEGLTNLLEILDAPEPRSEVIGDWLETQGAEAPPSLGWRSMCEPTPCPALPAWVLAWLAGELRPTPQTVKPSSKVTPRLARAWGWSSDVWQTPPAEIRRQVGQLWRGWPGCLERRRYRLDAFQYRRAIGPHLPALEAGHPRALAECLGTGSIGRDGGRTFPVASGLPYSNECPGCAGLGRIREEKSTAKVIVPPTHDTVQSWTR